MTRAIHLFLLSLLALPVMAGPADPAGGTGGDPLGGTLTVRVVAAGTTDPIAGAWVMVGPAEDQPFAGNTGFTNGSGEIVFDHASLTSPVTVTAGDTGRAYASLFDLAVSEIVLALPVLDSPQTARIGDEFLGIEVDNGPFCLGDGNLDMGIVMPAVSVEEALNGGALAAISTNSELVPTPFGDFPVPSSVYIPTQCELFVTIEKLSYHLRVPTGRRTLFGLSARAPMDSLLEAPSLVDLIESVDFREMDVLRDRTVFADSDGFDLTADLALTEDLTLEIANGQPGTTVFAAALGRITDVHGQDEFLLTGLDSFDPDLDGPSGTAILTTRAAEGELDDLVHGALVSQLEDDGAGGFGSGATTALVRAGFLPPATLPFNSFFDIVQVSSPDDTGFSWTDVRSPTSPGERHLNASRLVHLEETENPDDPESTMIARRTVWTLYTAGPDLDLVVPTLPESAPTLLPDPDATPEQDRIDFVHTVQFLGDDPDGFDYGSFALADAAGFGTHVSLNDRPLRCDTRSVIDSLLLAKGPGPDEVTLSWSGHADLCSDTIGARGYEVYAGDDSRPIVDPGAWPSDPFFTRITDEDRDGSLANAGFSHLPPDQGLVVYLVLDRGLSGNEGPAGHYGSH